MHINVTDNSLANRRIAGYILNMMRKSVFIALFILPAYVFGSIYELEKPAEISFEPKPTPKLNYLIEEADKGHKNRNDIEAVKRSLELYEEAIELDPTSAELQWKAARAAWWVGRHAKEKKLKRKLFKKGIEYAKQSIKFDPNSPSAHLWLAGNYASYGRAKGILRSLFLIKPIRRELEKVIDLDPAFKGGVGYRILGLVDYKVPRLVGGSKKRALERLQKAMEIDETHPDNVYYMGEFYRETKQYEKSIPYYRKLQYLSAPTEEDIAYLQELQQKGAEHLKKLEQKTRKK